MPTIAPLLVIIGICIGFLLGIATTTIAIRRANFGDLIDSAIIQLSQPFISRDPNSQFEHCPFLLVLLHQGPKVAAKLVFSRIKYLLQNGECKKYYR